MMKLSRVMRATKCSNKSRVGRKKKKLLDVVPQPFPNQEERKNMRPEVRGKRARNQWQ